jgi:hypothetical protein
MFGKRDFQPGFCLGNRVFAVKNPVSKAETGLTQTVADRLLVKA